MKSPTTEGFVTPAVEKSEPQAMETPSSAPRFQPARGEGVPEPDYPAHSDTMKTGPVSGSSSLSETKEVLAQVQIAQWKAEETAEALRNEGETVSKDVVGSCFLHCEQQTIRPILGRPDACAIFCRRPQSSRK